MAYIALKPCRFAGQSFRIGESVPVDLVQPGAAKSLVRMGIIVEGEPEAASTKSEETTIEAPNAAITVTIHAKEGDMPLDLTPEGLQAVFDVLTTTVSEAEAIINGMTDGDALILLNISDNRRTIQNLTEERAKALIAPQEAETAPENEENVENDETLEDDVKNAQEGEESAGEQ